jgi:hypothetical protein
MHDKIWKELQFLMSLEKAFIFEFQNTEVFFLTVRFSVWEL